MYGPEGDDTGHVRRSKVGRGNHATLEDELNGADDGDNDESNDEGNIIQIRPPGIERDACGLTVLVPLFIGGRAVQTTKPST